MKRSITILLLVATWICFWLISGSACAQTPISSHPRILVNTRLTRLKAEMTANSSRWQKVKSLADSVITSGTSEDGMVACALVYQAIGNASYATAAIRILTAITSNSGYLASSATPTIPLSYDSAYYYRYTMPNVSCAHDWVWNAETASQRAQIAKWLMDRADWVWPDTNPARAGAWAVTDASNNYWWGFLSSWLAALSAYGDDTRAVNHLTLARQTKFGFAKSSYLDGWGAGGVFAEGTSYGPRSQFELGIYIEAHRTATGEDLMPLVPHVRDAVLWDIHSTSPDLAYTYPLGDQARMSMAPWYDYYRYPLLLSDMQTDAKVKSWARSLLDSEPAPTNSLVTNWELLFYPSDIAAADYKTAAPTDFFAPGTGFFSRRTDWTANSTWWGIHAGRLEESHQDEEGGFLIWKNGWIVSDAIIYSASGINDASNPSANTLMHNLVTSGGKGQYWTQGEYGIGTSVGGTVIAHEAGADYSVYEADLHLLYHQPRLAPFLSDYVRKVIHVRDDVWLIDDRLAGDAGSRREFHIHSKAQPAVTGNAFAWNSGAYTLQGTTLTPGATVTAVPLNLGNGGALSSYRTDIVSAGTSGTDRLLNVLQVVPVGTAAIPITQIACGTHSVVQVGKWILGSGKTESVAGTVQYTYNGTGPTEHVLTDLLPNSVYGGSISSASGVLRFSMPAGTSTISISPGSVTPPPPAPKLASIALTPTSATMVTGVSIQFTASGFDQSGKPFALGSLTWAATGGTVSSSGLYSAGSVSGQFVISAVSGGITGISNVTVTAPDYQALWAADEVKIAGLNGQITTLQGQLATANSALATVTAQRNALQSVMDALNAAIRKALLGAGYP